MTKDDTVAHCVLHEYVIDDGKLAMKCKNPYL